MLYIVFKVPAIIMQLSRSFEEGNNKGRCAIVFLGLVCGKCERERDILCKCGCKCFTDETCVQFSIMSHD